MSDKKRKRNVRAPQYKWAPGAISVTLHSTDGSPVDPVILQELEVKATALALENNLVVNVARA